MQTGAPKFRTRPTVDVWCVCALLDRREDQVLGMVEDGTLPWAIDIRRARSRRRAVRIWSRCVRSLIAGEAVADMLPEQAVQCLVPGDSPNVSGVQIARAFNCSSTHVNDLVRDGDLRLVHPKTGRTTTPLITRKSLAAFIERRRIQ